MSKQIIIWVLVFMGAIVLLLVIAQLGSSSGNSEPIPEVAVIRDIDHVAGNSEGRHTFIEYGDFECPACGAIFPLIKDLEVELGQDMAFIFRHFPLSQHKNARLAANAAEAAGKQGKFWEMHDLLFEGQGRWAGAADARVVFIGYANDLELDASQFNADLDSGELADRVEDDYRDGLGFGVNSTPTFFVDGVKISNNLNYEIFKQSVLNVINAQSNE